MKNKYQVGMVRFRQRDIASKTVHLMPYVLNAVFSQFLGLKVAVFEPAYRVPGMNSTQDDAPLAVIHVI